MGLENGSKKLSYLNISNGKLVYKENGSEEKKTADSVFGVIKKVEFCDDEYNGQSFNKAKIVISDGGEIDYLLQMRTDSGYFRGLCNSLRSGNPLESIKISPSAKEVNGKKQITCFVQQDGKWLKHFFNKDNNGDLPILEKVSFKGKDIYDGTAQVNYWKEWLFETYNNANSTEQVNPEEHSIDSFESDNDIPF
jgi:hypothetical protein